MEKTEFITIFCTFENFEIVQKALPTVIKETNRTGSKLIVHDSSIKGRDEKWSYLQKLEQEHHFFLILSSPVSMAYARNLCLHFCIERFNPENICLMEDDHGFKEGFISSMLKALKTYYGKQSPNGFLYGLFTGCKKHYFEKLHVLEDGNAYPDWNNSPGRLGGVNSCIRCAPTQHWVSVLKGYDLDEYPISSFQTAPLNYRNYHRGYTIMIVDNGEKTFEVDNVGRGVTTAEKLPLWDNDFAANDRRAKYEKPQMNGKLEIGKIVQTECSANNIIDNSNFTSFISKNNLFDIHQYLCNTYPDTYFSICKNVLHSKDDLFHNRMNEEDIRNVCIAARKKNMAEKIFFIGDLPFIVDMKTFFLGAGVQLIQSIDEVDNLKEKIVLIPCFNSDVSLLKILKSIMNKPNILYFMPQKAHPPSRYFHRNSIAFDVLKEDAKIDMAQYDLADFENIIMALDLTKSLPGDYVEIGVYKGRSAHIALNYMQRTNISRNAWLFDTYEGFNYDTAYQSSDAFWSGWHSDTNIEKVSKFLDFYPNKIIQKLNIINESLPNRLKKIAICNIDVDLYEAVKNSIKKVVPLMERGGIIILEDQGHTPLCAGAYLALNQFLESNESNHFFPIPMSSGQMFLIKR